MDTVAKGIRGHSLDWNMILLGVGIGVFCILLDEILRHFKMCLPVLAIGLGVYLPPEVTTPIVFGSAISYWTLHRRAKRGETAVIKQSSILLACGLVAGSAIMGVLLAIPFALLGSADALSIMPDSLGYVADILGGLSVLVLGSWIAKKS
jgi:putative OPT family oligopeptide transporter